jgi:hypothetical protein
MNRFARSLESNSDAMGLFDTMKEMYQFIKDDSKFRLTPSQVTVTNDNHHIVDEKYPDIAEFRKKYKMSNFMLILEFHNVKFYQKMPHSHNIEGTTGSIFWPLIFSEYAATSFYLPPEETIVDLHVPGTYFKLKECNWNQPEEVIQLRCPSIFHMNHFHKPTILSDHSDNSKRVICNWEAAAGISFEDLTKELL